MNKKLNQQISDIFKNNSDWLAMALPARICKLKELATNSHRVSRRSGGSLKMKNHCFDPSA